MKCRKLLCGYIIPENNRIKFAVIQDCSGCGAGTYFNDIYDTFFEALGRVMFNIFDYVNSYDENDRPNWKFTDPYLLEGDGGYAVDVTYKGKLDTKYYILFHDLDEDDDVFEMKDEEK